MTDKIKIILTTALIMSAAINPSMAQVPVNDADRTDTETRTKVCMQRARTFKQASVSPTRGVTTSVSTRGDLAGMGGVSGQSVLGQALSGTRVGGNDFQILMAVANSVTSLKTKNVGQTVSALAAVAAAISANTTTLKTQSTAIGTTNSIQGSFDQNAMIRLSSAQIWNQAIQAVTTANSIRNQKLLDGAADASATSTFMSFDTSKSSLVNP